ncbi:hypothetical protein BpHYR1_014232 [Brachionus plicatilis]|uniref:Uncharacterized protein n=1 Tax=Brachionus plicatilis TaxID=10195 RepID=A0A3M7SCI5_BRAPC|nr:hypothetical protein BpHYR1_014232 [Brachionus plicatilis]
MRGGISIVSGKDQSQVTTSDKFNNTIRTMEHLVCRFMYFRKRKEQFITNQWSVNPFQNNEERIKNDLFLIMV